MSIKTFGALKSIRSYHAIHAIEIGGRLDLEVWVLAYNIGRETSN